jgi:hypothetical protein
MSRDLDGTRQRAMLVSCHCRHKRVICAREMMQYHYGAKLDPVRRLTYHRHSCFSK